MSKETELGPCPFCGKKLEARWERANPRAKCATDACKGSQIPVINLDSQADIDAWNTRADTSGDWVVGDTPTDTRAQWWLCTTDLEDGDDPMSWPIYRENGKWFYDDDTGALEYKSKIIAHRPLPPPYQPDEQEAKDV